MIQGEHFLKALHDAGFGLISGVPCSYLTPLINGSINSSTMRYVNAANEGEAVAIAAGASLGGLGGVAMFQNSGLGNAVSPLTSLTWLFRIPILLITTWRGEPDGPGDEPQHELMGRITMDQLALMEIPVRPFPRTDAEIDGTLTEAMQFMEEHGRPFALVMSKGSVAAEPLLARDEPPRAFETAKADDLPAPALDPGEVMHAVHGALDPADIVIASTGFTGRALYQAGDRDNQLYMVGSMGCASTLGLGLAIARPERRVVVLDGDGALLMRMGAIAALGLEGPPNLLHVVIDNGVHDSTGAQESLAASVQFPQLAAACGYPQAETLGSLDAVADRIADRLPGLRLCHVRTRPRADRSLPRPDTPPDAIARRLRSFLESES